MTIESIAPREIDYCCEQDDEIRTHDDRDSGRTGAGGSEAGVTRVCPAVDSRIGSHVCSHGVCLVGRNRGNSSAVAELFIRGIHGDGVLHRDRAGMDCDAAVSQVSDRKLRRQPSARCHPTATDPP